MRYLAGVTNTKLVTNAMLNDETRFAHLDAILLQ